MHRRRDRRDGFTVVELLVTIVVIGLLSAGAVRADIHLKRRAVERVVMGDLDAYAEAQMAQREEGGGFAPTPELLAAGFEWSDGIEVSDAQVVRDRFFVRIRHQPSGYSCALDLSPATGRARNRKVCRASASDPALARPPGIIVTPPPADTQTVARPPSFPPDGDGYLLPPDVGDLAEVVLDPGASRVLLFPVENRSGEPRLFTFDGVSSNPSVVPHPGAPADALLTSRERASIPLTVTVLPGTLADDAAEVDLRANDAGDRSYSGSGRVRVRAALVLANPAVSVPAGEIRDPGESFTVQYRVRNLSNATRVFRVAPVMPAGSALSLAGAVPDLELAPNEERAVPIAYILAAWAEGGSVWSARITVTDRDASAFSRTSGDFQVTARLILLAPVVSGPAESVQTPGAEFTLLWQVENRSNADREFLVTGGASGGLSAGTPVTRRIPRGESLAVPYTFRLSDDATCGTVHVASVRVDDVGAPAYRGDASGDVRAATVLAAPGVAAPAARSDQPGASFSARWEVVNQSNCARDVRVDVLPDGDAEVAGITGGGVVRLQPFERRPVDVLYRMRDRSLHQTQSRPAARATDQLEPAYSAAASFLETTALRLCSPVVEGPVVPAPQPQQPGTGATLVHRVTNCSNAARTFAFVAASTNPGAVGDPADPSPREVAAFATVEVSFAYLLAGTAYGGSFSDLVFRAVDGGDESLTGARAFRVTAAVVVNAPLLTAFPDQVLAPAGDGAAQAQLVSRSNIHVDFCFTAELAPGTAPAGRVVAAASQVPCVRVPPFETAVVEQRFVGAVLAEHPLTNAVVVRAFDAARPALGTTQSIGVTAALVLAAPALQVPATPPPVGWMLSQERSVSYPVTNATNGARDLCIAVSPSGPELVSSNPGHVCAVVPARQEHVFSHVLRGNAAGEPTVSVTAYDRLAPAYSATAAYSARVVDARPVAVWTPPAPVYVRRWADFDASRSYSPAGARIVRYIWSWGLLNQRWTGTRFEVGGGGVASDAVAEPVTRRAYDIRGTFEVCLAVEDDAGRLSAPSCAPVTTLLQTRARLAFRYRGWWYSPSDFCVDVPWDNQCPDEHGNGRWEILLAPSQGDVPIRRAWASVRVNYWQTDDEFEQAYTYSGNVETLPYSFSSFGQTVTYDFLSNRHKANGSVQTGRWRILQTEGTGALGWPQAPGLDGHPLIVNANLGRATGMFDGGPHWVPDDVWITLNVEDAHGQITQQSAYLDHQRSEWRGGECINGTSGSRCIRGYERLTPPQPVPLVSIQRQQQADGSYRFTGSGESPDGRMVDSWWQVTRTSPLTGRDSFVVRGDAYQVDPGMCEVVDVLQVYVDDRGQLGSAGDRVLGFMSPFCDDIEPPL
ncbi:MAG TPA: prepilin-type N-terminal cleavage/methylation domain-containing protein [Longimicrobium sp.]|nr:prepilin-type N-terminal cleavage/methylation domain-containing protein [Longimicrobium sp.]